MNSGLYFFLLIGQAMEFCLFLKLEQRNTTKSKAIHHEYKTKVLFIEITHLHFITFDWPIQEKQTKDWEQSYS